MEVCLQYFRSAAPRSLDFFRTETTSRLDCKIQQAFRGQCEWDRFPHFPTAMRLQGPWPRQKRLPGLSIYSQDWDP